MTTDLHMTKADYGIHRASPLGYDRAVEAVTEALKAEGFGLLTEIDVKATMKAKLDVEFPRYVILGACNPPLAHKALSAVPDIGLLLPCNVVVLERADGTTEVSALRPTVVFSRLVHEAGVEEVARDAEARITRALDAFAARSS